MSDIWHIPEPRCIFGHEQSMEHPKDGLTAFGPIHDRRQPQEMRIGAVGTSDGLRYFRQWVASIQGAIGAPDADDPKYSLFPGFTATFRCNWNPEPIESIEISNTSIDEAIRHADPYQAIYNTVGLFEDRIRKYIAQEEATVSAWFVIIPEKVYEFGRPRSQAPKAERTNVDEFLRHSEAPRISTEPFFPFLDALNRAADMHAYARNFRDQLKGRLLDRGAVVQVVRETTLAPHAFMRSNPPRCTPVTGIR